MRVYLAGPISGLNYDNATDWRGHYAERLRRLGHTSMSPMRGKERLGKRRKIRGATEEIPVASSKGIYGRDCWDVAHCDVIVARLLDATEVSIGTVMEIQRAHDLDKYVLVIMEQKGNYHDHPFVREAASLVVTTDEEAIEILEILGEGY